MGIKTSRIVKVKEETDEEGNKVVTLPPLQMGKTLFVNGIKGEAVYMEQDKTIVKIQPAERSDMTLPYPYFIDSDGYVGKQEFWQGHPYKLIGFSKTPTAGTMELTFSEFWKDPKQAIKMFPVMSNTEDDWFTVLEHIESVDTIKKGKK